MLDDFASNLAAQNELFLLGLGLAVGDFLEAGAENRSTWLRPDRSELSDIIISLKDCATVVDVPGPEISAENSTTSPQF